MKNSQAAGGDGPKSLLSQHVSTLLQKGKYELFDTDIETVWQKPEAPAATKGVVLIAHGCHHGAIDFWPKSESCPNCIGLPEEMNITLHSLLRGYAVFAVSSYDRLGHRCWQMPFTSKDPAATGDPTNDFVRVKSALTQWLSRERLSGLPLLALGGSSGGAFVLHLAAHMAGAFRGVAAQIMAVMASTYREYDSKRKAGAVSAPYPPVLFIHMPRDTHVAYLVAKNMEELKAIGTPASELRVHPQPLTPLYLAQRCAPEVDEATSRAVYEAFKSTGLLDPSGYLLHNPRGGRGRGRTPWQAAIQAHVPGAERLRLSPDASPISEELNLLYAQHELCSETTTDMLDWFEGFGGSGRQGAQGGDSAAAS